MVARQERRAGDPCGGAVEAVSYPMDIIQIEISEREREREVLKSPVYKIHYKREFQRSLKQSTEKVTKGK